MLTSINPSTPQTGSDATHNFYFCTVIEDIPITVLGNSSVRANDDELKAYIKRGREKASPGQTLCGIQLSITDDVVSIDYNYRAESFERIRRITGYLVGSLSRFNNAKRAEEHDRIKHSL